MPELFYLITLDSHEYFGPFQDIATAMDWAMATNRDSYQLAGSLKKYEREQLQVPRIRRRLCIE